MKALSVLLLAVMVSASGGASRGTVDTPRSTVLVFSIARPDATAVARARHESLPPEIRPADVRSCAAIRVAIGQRFHLTSIVEEHNRRQLNIEGTLNGAGPEWISLSVKVTDGDNAIDTTVDVKRGRLVVVGSSPAASGTFVLAVRAGNGHTEARGEL